MFIHKIIHNLKHIAAGVKSCEQKFIVISFNETIKKRVHESSADIIFCDTVLECRIIKFVDSEGNCKTPVFAIATA